jgi:hypothetical protein
VLLGVREAVEWAGSGVRKLFVERGPIVVASLGITDPAEVLALSGTESVERHVPRNPDDPGSKGFPRTKASLSLDRATHGLARAVFHVGVLATLVQDGCDDRPHERRQRSEVAVDRRDRGLAHSGVRLN